MEPVKINIRDYFRFRPLKTAKVSEISEATALSPLPSEQRLNFHIGHPVQDPRLISLYYNLVTGMEILNINSEEDEDNLLEKNGWSADQKGDLSFIAETIRKSIPYLPRGGYHKQIPDKLILHLKDWLMQGQHEPLSYSFGDESSPKECMLATGGIWETLRFFFHALSVNLEMAPGRVCYHQLALPDRLTNFSNLNFYQLAEDENIALNQVMDLFNDQLAFQPTFLILGKIPSESTRRQLRYFSLQHPVYFVEINQAPNHLSFSREAKMRDRVLRIIHSSILDSAFSQSSVEFILGPNDLIQVMEAAQFELKGTPSATEIELLIYLLSRDHPHQVSEPVYHTNKISDPDDDTSHQEKFHQHLSHSFGLVNRLEERIQSTTTLVERSIDTLKMHQRSLTSIINRYPASESNETDQWSALKSGQIFRQFFHYFQDKIWLKQLEDNFLDSFIKHHPEYEKRASLVISGSARTALSLFGFHCGFREVLTADLGWTYEHCFPKVEAITVSPALQPDPDLMIKTIRNKIEQQPDWKSFGAVILNNPHNASGSVIEEKEMIGLLRFLLDNEIYTIDDLSYQNVLPRANLKGPKTLRQLSRELIQNGYLSSDKEKYLITVHSLSKTDCYAGARVAVIEIPDVHLFERYKQISEQITPNTMAILLAYLFYRNQPGAVKSYWKLRNTILQERMESIEKAVDQLPEDRNPYQLSVHRPQGAMYPRLTVNQLPDGLSLDWLSSNLATSGIGLIPLTTFARTANGYSTARKSFRLTLGGSDNAEALSGKMRRLIIDLNRLIANEESRYNLRQFKPVPVKQISKSLFPDFTDKWASMQDRLFQISQRKFEQISNKNHFNITSNNHKNIFKDEYLPDRLSILHQQVKEHIEVSERILGLINNGEKKFLFDPLAAEFYKDNLENRAIRFRKRLYDRTVHPTQMYSLRVDGEFQNLIEHYLSTGLFSSGIVQNLCDALINEYFGINVPISSIEEADELILDLNAVIAAEKYTYWNTGECSQMLLSFWGDWDGSNRPSGQGHRLVSSAVLENVNQMSKLLILLTQHDSNFKMDPALRDEILNLQAKNNRFWKLLNNITHLTNQLEKRYRSVAPTQISPGRFKKTAIRLHLARDPYTRLWQHNDRLEKRMLHMRLQRRSSLEYYFELNKRLRKELFRSLDQIESNFHQPEIALAFSGYRDLLKRFVLSPRIHQRIITSDDPFTIDTTIHNLTEINEISGKFGNPGMILALQVSMSTDPDAFIQLERKIRTYQEFAARANPAHQIAPLWVIPLFEDLQAIENLPQYLDKIWQYTVQSRRLDQSEKERFSEMVCEIFFAGSDLSQQIGQPAAAALYGKAKYTTMRWLAGHDLVDRVRVKLGSGETMQRQGGYYDIGSENPPFIQSHKLHRRMQLHLKESTQRSIEFAKSPLRGVLASGDLRTFQSTLSEKIRSIAVKDRAGLFYHISRLQKFHDDEIYRIAEPLLDTRLQFQERGLQEMEAFICKKQDPLFKQFLDHCTENFRQILYGREEDVVGIHVISHFISRSILELRDRPTVRPGRQSGKAMDQKILERLSQTLPLSRHGSMLRAIGHNRAQTMILGINQLTTGLFRALSHFTEEIGSSEDINTILSNRILPKLPVREILLSLFLYQDHSLEYLGELEKAFPAGNSAFLCIREDMDSISRYLGLFQKEYLRRYGLDIGDFFKGDVFIPDLLPILDPEIAILLQKDLFNTDTDKFLSDISGRIEDNWLNKIPSLLEKPVKIRYGRKQIWQSLMTPIFNQVNSFVELAHAIMAISQMQKSHSEKFSGNISDIIRKGTRVSRQLRGSSDDSLKQFLTDVVQILTQLPGNMTEIRVDILRALQDVERIVQIEEQVLSGKEQIQVRFHVLQIARLCGENG